MNRIREEREMIEEYRRHRYEDEGEQPIDWWQFGVVLMVVLMVLGMLTGCRTTKYVNVPEYHTEYIVRSDTMLQKDSVVLHDSVYVYRNGDTVIVNKVAYRDRWKNVYKTVTDTFIKRDSIPYKVEVEKSLTNKEKKYMSMGKAVYSAIPWLLAVLAVIGLLVWRRLKKK